MTEIKFKGLIGAFFNAETDEITLNFDIKQAEKKAKKRNYDNDWAIDIKQTHRKDADYFMQLINHEFVHAILFRVLKQTPDWHATFAYDLIREKVDDAFEHSRETKEAIKINWNVLRKSKKFVI